MEGAERRHTLLQAVLQTLSDEGPNPTAFRASPSATYVCDGLPRRTAPGWWVAFGTALEVTSFVEGADDELVELRFRGDVHRGEPFSWLLSTTTDETGVRRLLLEDRASYPDRLPSWLQYHAIGQCRDALLQRTAVRLGQQAAAATGLRAVFGSVLAALGLVRGLPTPTAGAPAAEAEATTAAGGARATEGGAAPPPERPPHVWMPPPREAQPYRMLDETPRAVLEASQAARGVAPPPPAGVLAAEAFVLAAAAKQAGGGGGPERADAPEAGPLGGVDAAVVAGADARSSVSGPPVGVSGLLHDPSHGMSWNLAMSARTPRSDGSAEAAATDDGRGGAAARGIAGGFGAVGGGRPLQLTSGLSLSLDDQVDLLREQMPQHSTQTLRRMIDSQGFDAVVRRAALG